MASTFSLRQYVDIARRRRTIIVAIAIATVLVTAIQVFTTTPLYRAAAMLEIEPQATILPYQDLGSVVDPMDITTQIRLMQSSDVLGEVVEDLALTAHPAFIEPPSDGMFVEAGRLAMRLLKGRWRPRSNAPPTERWVQSRLLEDLSITPIRNTRLISVSYLSPDPELAASIANAVAEAFVQKSLRNRFNVREDASKFLSDQLAELKVSIQGSEERLIEYAQAKDIAVGANDNSTQRRLDEFVQQQTRAEADAETLRGYWRALAEGRLDLVPDEAKTEELRSLESRISIKQKELASLSARYGEQWPSVRELRAEIDGLGNELEAETSVAAEALRQRYLFARSRSSDLGARVSAERREAAVASQDTVEFEILRRETEANKQLYEAILQRLKEADIMSGLEQGGVRRSQEAVLPTSISAPNKTRAVGMAMFAGVLFGLGGAFLREMLDNTVKSTEDVTRRTGLVTLGAIARLEDERPGKRRRGKADASPTLAFSVRNDQAAQIRESYRAVRTSILLSTAGRPPKTLLVTSALPGEGKSTTVANLAIAFAQTGVRTLAIDLDLRRPTLGRLLNVRSKEGMSAYLSGNAELADLLVESPFPNLSVVPAGATAPNPVELMGSERVATCLAAAGEHFSHVIIDTPPALELSDALVLSPHVDGVVLVACAGATAAEALKRTAARFRAAGSRILGVLVNCADLKGPDYGHYYSRYRQRYGYKYGYGPAEDDVQPRQ